MEWCDFLGSFTDNRTMAWQELMAVGTWFLYFLFIYIPQVVVCGKYYNFQILFLYFCVYSCYLFINLLIFFIFLLFDEAYGRRGI